RLVRDRLDEGAFDRLAWFTEPVTDVHAERDAASFHVAGKFEVINWRGRLAAIRVFTGAVDGAARQDGQAAFGVAKERVLEARPDVRVAFFFELAAGLI